MTRSLRGPGVARVAALALVVLGALAAPAQAEEEAADTSGEVEEAEAAIPPVGRPASLLRELDGLRLDQVTLAGSHNTYEKKGCNPLASGCSAEEQSRTFHYIYDAFSHVQAIEIDVWTLLGWRVNHGGPTSANNNNCPKSGMPGATRNQDLRSCIESLRTWHLANPDHPLQIVKLEFKDGFMNNDPGALDELIANVSGRGSETRIPREWIFTPRDLMCWNGPCLATPDAAVRAGRWPTMGQLRGKFMFVIINGVSDNFWAGTFGFADGSIQYARTLRTGYTNLAWPSHLLKEPAAGDPRIARYGVDLAPWVVVFDMELGRVVLPENPAATTALAAWMKAGNYLRFTTVSRPTDVEMFGPIGGPTGSLARGNAVIAQVKSILGSNVITTDQEKLGLRFR